MARLSKEEAEEAERKGREGEQALYRWFNTNGFSYVYVNQEPEAFSPLFSGCVKRPDFMLLIDGVGLIAVDAKNKQLFQGEYSLANNKELTQTIAFERLFRMPVWYAYMSREEPGTWYWINSLKVLEVGKPRQNSENGEDFLSIPLEEFAKLQTAEDVGKLYTQRMPSIKVMGTITG